MIKKKKESKHYLFGYLDSLLSFVETFRVASLSFFELGSHRFEET